MWEVLEATALAQYLRASVYAYPLVNAAHIVGIALLFGAIVPVDLRLLGLWRRQDPAALLAICRPVAAFGLTLAVSAGVLLFIVRASEYTDKPAIWVKLLVVMAGIVNAGLAERALRRGAATASTLHAAASLLLWLVAIIAGRMVAYT